MPKIFQVQKLREVAKNQQILKIHKICRQTDFTFCRQTLLKIFDHSALHILFQVVSKFLTKASKLFGRLKRCWVYDIPNYDNKNSLLKFFIHIKSLKLLFTDY